MPWAMPRAFPPSSVRPAAREVTAAPTEGAAIVVSAERLALCSPVVDSGGPRPVLETGPIKARWALLFGVNQYVEPGLDLKFCLDDVETLGSALQSLGYNLQLVHDNQPAHLQPTYRNVRDALLKLKASCDPDDLLWVHFSSHGILIDGAPHLLLNDSRLSDRESMISVEEVCSFMRESGARRCFLSLDACHAGVNLGRDAGGQRLGLDPSYIRNAFELAEGFYILAASTATQEAQDDPESQHGAFTRFLVEALSGGDAHGKGFVTADDARDYVVAQTRAWVFSQGKHSQLPNAVASVTGDFILADRRSSSISPPPESRPMSGGSQGVHDTTRGARAAITHRAGATARPRPWWFAASGVIAVALVATGALVMRARDQAAAARARAALPVASVGGANSTAPQIATEVCGRFKEINLRALAGFKVSTCTDAGESGALALTGDGDLTSACKQVSDWVRSAGWTLTTQGSPASAFQRGSTILGVSCSRVAGQAVIALSLQDAAAGKVQGTPAATACGRFDEMHIPSVSGFLIFTCTDSPTYGSLVLRGDGQVDAACETVRAWARGSGWNQTAKTSKTSTFKQQATLLGIYCTRESAGSTVALTLWPAPAEPEPPTARARHHTGHR